MASEANDPLESLRQPVVPVAARAAFASVLRHRLEEAFDMSTSTIGETTGAVAPATPATTSVLVPYLTVDGADRAIAFYVEAFGAVETLRMAEPGGRIGHAEITIGSVTIMLSDEYPETDVVSPTTLGGTPVALHLEVGDVDVVHAQAVAAGATTVREPADQFHGNRNAVIRDPFGHRWMISTPVEEVSAETMRERALADGFETTTGTTTPESGSTERPISE